MSYVFVSPGKYIQGKGILKDIAEYTAPIGKKPFILFSAGGMKRFGDMVRKSFADQGIEPVMETFGGEVTRQEIDRQALTADSHGCDYVIGIGGGKVTDTGKFVAVRCKLPTVVCPTIAATDAPTPGRAVLYSEEGVSLKTYQLPRNPELVLVDAEVIGKAPVRLLVSGMGDALATRFETEACLSTNSKNPAGGYTTVAGASLARACYNTLIEFGAQAKKDAMNGDCSLAVERIVEVNTLLSGLGFESGGLASAHAINKGLTHVKDCDAYYHGEKVAFGTLCQLIMEGKDEELIKEVFDFCHSVGLPITLKEIGLTPDDTDKLMTAAKVAGDPAGHTKNEPMKVTPEMVYEAMLEVNRRGEKYSL
ncbi:MAG: glycerol dehydrogenase [Eubacterium sp.]|nr:glycerol dehydrogenase [Eubacterium sp.]